VFVNEVNAWLRDEVNRWTLAVCVYMQLGTEMERCVGTMRYVSFGGHNMQSHKKGKRDLLNVVRQPSLYKEKCIM
jgi:hypothetical protein